MTITSLTRNQILAAFAAWQDDFKANPTTFDSDITLFTGEELTEALFNYVPDCNQCDQSSRCRWPNCRQTGKGMGHFP